MRIKLLDSQKISEELLCHQGASPALMRRDFLKCAGLGLTVIAPVSFIARPVEARGGLIPVALAVLELLKEIWTVKEPSSGTIQLVNNTNIVRDGDVIYQILAQGGVENYKYATYTVPPYKVNTYEFFDGPCGFFPGRKMMLGGTARGQVRTNMVIEA